MPNTPDANLDPTSVVQGHNGEKQQFTVRREMLIQDRKTKRQCREFILEDNWGNHYLVYHAQLHDGETYSVQDWVRPSVLAKYGGWSNALIDDHRHRAFAAFEESAREINRMRSLADSLSIPDPSKLLITNARSAPNAK